MIYFWVKSCSYFTTISRSIPKLQLWLLGIILVSHFPNVHFPINTMLIFQLRRGGQGQQQQCWGLWWRREREQGTWPRRWCPHSCQYPRWGQHPRCSGHGEGNVVREEKETLEKWEKQGSERRLQLTMHSVTESHLMQSAKHCLTWVLGVSSSWNGEQKKNWSPRSSNIPTFLIPNSQCSRQQQCRS